MQTWTWEISLDRPSPKIGHQSNRRSIMMMDKTDRREPPSTQFLERAIAQLKTRSIDEQDAIAAMILEELEDDRH